jgi:hypothetical protein
MTISDAHINFKFLIDKADVLNYPNFLSEEIDLLFTIAQERIIKQRYGKNNIKRTSFEEEQKRTEDLKAILKTAILNPETAGSTGTTSSKGVFFELPEDHWFIIWEKAYVECSSCNTNIVLPGGDIIIGIEVEVRPTTHMEYERNKKDPFKGPDNEKILRLMYQNNVELIPSDDCVVLNYIYRYVSKPTPPSLADNQTFVLSEHMHQEIIDEAVKIALENIEAKRTGTFTQVVDNQKE